MMAARVLGEDPTAETVERRVRMLVDATAAAATVKKADEVAWPGMWTHAETLRANIITALAGMKGADASLKDATGRAAGLPRACVVIARAQRGDRSAHDDVVKLLDDAEAGILRVPAARVLGLIGGKEDVPLLERVAKSDPLERKQGGCEEPQRMCFPVRASAAEAVRTIEKRLAATPCPRPTRKAPPPRPPQRGPASMFRRPGPHTSREHAISGFQEFLNPWNPRILGFHLLLDFMDFTISLYGAEGRTALCAQTPNPAIPKIPTPNGRNLIGIFGIAGFGDLVDLVCPRISRCRGLQEMK